MLDLVKLSFKNLGRDRKRSFTRLIGLASVTAALIIWGSITNGFSKLLFKVSTSLDSGIYQVYAPEYFETENFYKAMKLKDEGADLDRMGFPYSYRKYSNVLGAFKNNSVGLRVVAVDPIKETKVTNFHKHLEEGQWLSGKYGEVIVGKKLKKKLSLKIGDEIILLGQAADGSIASAVFNVVGVFKGVNQLVDRRSIFISHRSFDELFLFNKRFHEIAIAFSSHDEAKGLAVLKKNFSKLDVKSWRDVKASLASAIDMLSVTIYFTLSFIYLVVAGILVNINLMVLYDRMKEYGTILALGMKPYQLFLLSLFESIWLSIASIFLSLLIGVPIALLFQRFGLDVSFVVDSLAFSGVVVEPVIYASLGLKQILSPTIFLFVTMFITSIYPSYRAANLDALEAMKGGVST